MPRQDLEGTLTSSQVARLLGVSAQRVIQLANAGRLAHTRTDLGRLYDPADVQRLIRERAAKGAA